MKEDDHEIYILYREVELTRNIRLASCGGWAACWRWSVKRYPKKQWKEYMEGRPVGRLGGRWLDAVARDAKRVLKYRNWRRSAEGRHACRSGRDWWGKDPNWAAAPKKKKKKNNNNKKKSLKRTEKWKCREEVCSVLWCFILVLYCVQPHSVTVENINGIWVCCSW